MTDAKHASRSPTPHAPLPPMVHVVDDDPALRSALGLLLEGNGYAVRTYADAQAFLDTEIECRPGCILLDIAMPGMSGIELQKRIVDRECPLPVLFLSGHGTPTAGFDAARRGAVEFLVKPVRNERLLEAVASAVNASHATTRRARDLAALTPRQREIYTLTEQGKRNTEIAQLLKISPKTVEYHKANIRKILEDRTAENAD